MSWDTVKRALKRLRCSYRRARRAPAKAPSAAAQAAAQRALVKLHRLEASGRCDVLYGDASGFSLQPCLPYLWQLPGQTLNLPTQTHSQRLSVLGFWRGDNVLWSYPTLKRVTAQHFVQSVEALLPTLRRETVLVIDNGPAHRAKSVQERRATWRKQGLRLLFLPPYCPHLNRIEVLWRQIKSRWLWPEAYADFATLCQSVTSILDQVGSKYRITFA